jgi:hypothetical protein
MKHIAIIVIIFLATGFACHGQQSFTAGNIVVYRTGDGSGILTTAAAPVFLVEYTPDGILVQSIPMPTAVSGSNKILTSRGLGGGRTEGMINLSSDGKSLVVPGINAALGTTTSLGAVMGVVDFNGRVNTSTVITDFAENNNIPFSAISDNGQRFWFSGFGAIRYATAGSSSSVKIVDQSSMISDFAIANGQLYVASNLAPAGIYGVGSGLPETGLQTLNRLPGLSLSMNPMQYEFADLDASVPGADVLYMADQGTPGGLVKYSLVAGTWVSNGNIGMGTNNYSNLTLRVSNNVVTIFAVRQGANSNGVRGGELIKLADNSGYNGTITGTPIVLASVAIANTMAFRGVALVPQPAPFTPGNMIVYRVGDGSAVLTTAAAPVFLDEYTLNGTLVQSIAMPKVANGNNKTLTARGLGGGRFEGMINLTSDGRNLVVPGINAAVGTTTSPGAVMGLLDFNARINTSTVVTDFTENSNIPFSAISDNGQRFWFGGFGAIRYATAGSSSSIKIADVSATVNDFSIADGQLYVSSDMAPSGVYKVGNRLPETGLQSLNRLPGLSLSMNAMQYEFADLDANVPGADVLFIADQGTPGGLVKYSLVGGVWVSNGNIGVGTDNYSNLAIRVSDNVVTIFAVRKGANSNGVRGGELIKLIDDSGYNGPITGTPIVVATVPVANTMAFRGVSRVPVGCPAVTGLRVPDITTTQANALWDAPVNGSGNYEWALSNTSALPVSGTATTGTSTSLTGLSNSTLYYVHVRTTCDALNVSEWSTVSFTTGCKPPPAPLVSVIVNNSGTVTVKWRKVFGAVNYEYMISVNDTPPASGIALTDTIVDILNLTAITKYYLHVRSACGSGTWSNWTTRAFTTSCFMPAPVLAMAPGNAKVTWKKISNAVQYEYALSYSPFKPLSGVVTTDTFRHIPFVDKATAYYFHVRSICSNGIVSAWNTLHFDTEGLHVWPNPVTDMLQVKLPGINSAGGTLIILDATGRAMVRLKLTSSAASIDTKGWARGFYFLKYTDQQYQFTKHIIKQ